MPFPPLLATCAAGACPVAGLAQGWQHCPSGCLNLWGHDLQPPALARPFCATARAPCPQPQLHRARALAAAATTNVVLAHEPGVAVPRLGGSLPVALEVCLSTVPTCSLPVSGFSRQAGC